MVMKQNASLDYTEGTHMLSVLQGAENVMLSIIKEASSNRISVGMKVESWICLTYPRASPVKPMSNCCLKQDK